MNFQKAHIPNNIDTYEKLAIWLGDIMRTAMPTNSIQEREPNLAANDTGFQRRIETIGPVRSAAGDMVKIIRFCISVQEDYASASYPTPYSAAREIAEVDPPANMIQA